MPKNPTTSTQSANAPNGVELIVCTAPFLSACWPEWPNAIWRAIQPMTAYMMPRATNPARASHFIAGLFAACLPADLAEDMLP